MWLRPALAHPPQQCSAQQVFLHSCWVRTWSWTEHHVSSTIWRIPAAHSGAHIPVVSCVYDIFEIKQKFSVHWNYLHFHGVFLESFVFIWISSMPIMSWQSRRKRPRTPCRRGAPGKKGAPKSHWVLLLRHILRHQNWTHQELISHI